MMKQKWSDMFDFLMTESESNVTEKQHANAFHAPFMLLRKLSITFGFRFINSTRDIRSEVLRLTIYMPTHTEHNKRKYVFKRGLQN